MDEWWDATRESKLLVQRCSACGHHQHYPRALCTSCHGTDLALVEASGRGVVHSFTVVHRAPRADVDVPYVVALVDLEEGVRLLTHVVGCPPEAVRCDQPVAVEWRAHDDGTHVPVFRPVEV